MYVRVFMCLCVRVRVCILFGQICGAWAGHAQSWSAHVQYRGKRRGESAVGRLPVGGRSVGLAQDELELFYGFSNPVRTSIGLRGVRVGYLAFR